MAQIHWSIIALAGSKREIWTLKKDIEKDKTFDRVITIDMSDDYGEFPDTIDYENWEEIELDQEDSAVFPFMQKCMDACIDFVNKKSDSVSGLGYMNIEGTIHWPKFGGKIFGVTGHVTAEPMLIKKGMLN